MISVVIALYNEEQRIQKNCDELRSYLDTLGEPWEIILVDDGSVDGTLAYLRNLAEQDSRVRVMATRRNMGQGAAVKLGMLSTRGDVVLYCDADFPVPLPTIKKFVDHVRQGADVVIASRWMPNARIDVPQPAGRRALGRAYYWMVHRLFLADIHDTNCGLKAYQGQVARLLFGFVRSWRWAFNVEHLWLARRCGYDIVETPVQWSHRGGSKVHVFRDCLFTLWEIFWLKVRQGFGLYPEIVNKRV